MPAIINTVNVNSLTGVFNIGDAYLISPKSTFKTFAGGGSFNSAKYMNVNNPKSLVNIYESDANGHSVMIQEEYG